MRMLGNRISNFARKPFQFQLIVPNSAPLDRALRSARPKEASVKRPAELIERDGQSYHAMRATSMNEKKKRKGRGGPILGARAPPISSAGARRDSGGPHQRAVLDPMTSLICAKKSGERRARWLGASQKFIRLNRIAARCRRSRGSIPSCRSFAKNRQNAPSREGCDPVERALARPDRGRVRVRFWPSAHWDRRLSLVCAATRTETWM